MLTLRRMRRFFRIALAVMLVLSALAAIALYTPVVGSRRAYQEQYDQLRLTLHQRIAETAPLQDIEAKLERARRQTDRFYAERLPAQASAIADRLGALAGKSGVRIAQVRYQTEEVEVPGVQRVRIEAGLAGDYLQVVRFINALERDPIFFIVDSLELAEQQGGAVRVEVVVETFLRDASAPPQQPPALQEQTS